MDPVSQGVLGAVAALSIAKPNHSRLAALLGCAGGMLADLDILIRSSEDPLLNIEYHRHFSHSLAFIPIGGLIAALVFLPLLRKRLKPVAIYLYSTIGYATAGLLDSCTSYGTQLLWPFSNARISWSIISIIDPLFTVPLLAMALLAVVKNRPIFGKSAAVFAIAYLSLGVIQNRRANSFLESIIANRGHEPATRLTVKPSIANLVLWRSLYLYEGHYYVDAVRVGFFGENLIYPGSKLPAFDTQAALDSVKPSSPIADDLQRFEHFSEGYLAALPDEPSFITDLRYSAIPNSIAPLWGIDISNTNASGHAVFETRRDISQSERKAFVQMLTGRPVSASN
ncbi:metal-dependent hydrolase [Pelagicoccus sp. SDUM812002]|uniref:metal-dependent hydrolase n=1 Tax=Pelagicoccus sp. SDUM812002 TaxID=3041266 RepID=UPI0028100CDB|nr:metal-dependent hydrolase [Pelagicoccus sp. SDUM812002]MDQ8186702.1 metal-dependent hydrolase [Pelagicoccus sp. SDUM812002]